MGPEGPAGGGGWRISKPGSADRRPLVPQGNQGGHGRSAAAAHRRSLPPGRLAILIGSEAHGLPDDVVADSRLSVTIPMGGPTESLNAAAAAAILAYEVSRQIERRPRDPGPFLDRFLRGQTVLLPMLR